MLPLVNHQTWKELIVAGLTRAMRYLLCRDLQAKQATFVIGVLSTIFYLDVTHPPRLLLRPLTMYRLCKLFLSMNDDDVTQVTLTFLADLLRHHPKQISSATMTTDYAMQNVLLQLHLTLLSPTLQRIKTIKSHILRCHACFLTTKEMTKQFCPRCGQPALQRVSCSTNAKGKFQIHLSRNYQWNNRGNKYSVPKPVAGTASGKGVKGGGKGGWGNDLVLAEDQKEYARQISEGKRTKTRDLMDEDYLPSILLLKKLQYAIPTSQKKMKMHKVKKKKKSKYYYHQQQG